MEYDQQNQSVEYQPSTNPITEVGEKKMIFGIEKLIRKLLIAAGLVALLGSSVGCTVRMATERDLEPYRSGHFYDGGNPEGHYDFVPMVIVEK